MDYKTYSKIFEQLISSEIHEPPYTDAQYLKYAKLNFSRMNRWQKTLQLNEELVAEIKKIKSLQNR
jgi:hypothetical protein